MCFLAYRTGNKFKILIKKQVKFILDSYHQYVIL